MGEEEKRVRSRRFEGSARCLACWSSLYTHCPRCPAPCQPTLRSTASLCVACTARASPRPEQLALPRSQWLIRLRGRGRRACRARLSRYSLPPTPPTLLNPLSVRAPFPRSNRPHLADTPLVGMQLCSPRPNHPQRRRTRSTQSRERSREATAGSASRRSSRPRRTTSSLRVGTSLEWTSMARERDTQSSEFRQECCGRERTELTSSFAFAGTCSASATPAPTS